MTNEVDLKNLKFDSEWWEAVERLTLQVVKISTPLYTGTGYFISKVQDSKICGIATAKHVIEHAHYWEQPIRIEQAATGKIQLLHHADRAIWTHQNTDTATIIFVTKEVVPPNEILPITPRGNHFKPGIEVGWLGYPAIPIASLCFFTGHISAWLGEDRGYLVDGVAINGVSGGPAFVKEGMLMGVVSSYIPNRETGESLPGLSLIQDVTQFHADIETLRTIKDAKEKEIPPTDPPSSRKSGTQ